MEETINLLDLKQLEEVVKVLKSARRIFLFGVGSSGVTAEDAKIVDAYWFSSGCFR